ncbi:signal transduction histidine kinase [Saccharothrix tamanrassetensis]|uniref:histidine kinase n=1 Tax=Saccharothrix tamanrassetensis TaxID=1051531 RepID=A0A841CCD9_9PSEU|nr:ATP-binding protein [Saccharothrix tamanrassetensis]MBB5953838.1 signal transduction histidine kinase [Saccharothrix tamanrassetensis]
MSAHTPSSDSLAGPPAWPVVIAAASTLVVASALVAWAALVAPQYARTTVGLCASAAALALVVAVAFAVWQRSAARHFRGRAAALAAESADLAQRLAPALVERLRAGSSAETALTEVERPVNPDHDRVLRLLAEEVGRGERTRAAAMAACGNAAGRMQALATSMLADLREMEDRHGEEVLGDLLQLDHSTAQAGRLADSIAVLTGSRSGRRWTKPIVMESILRGAVGRVSAYQRVRTHSASSSAIVGYAAEGVMHALAELIDNACSFSPPSEQVHVYVEEVQAGVVVTIEDGGLVMGDLALRRAEQTVSGRSFDLAGLSGTRLGLAVVGRLARKHGLTVSFRPSSRGGTGVIVMIPRTLVTESRPSGGKRRSPSSAGPMDSGEAYSERVIPAIEPLVIPAPQDHATRRSTEPAVDREPPEEQVVLPRRQRGSTLGSAFPVLPSNLPEPAAPRVDAGSRFSAFRRAGRFGRDARPEVDPPENHGPRNPGTDLHGAESHGAEFHDAEFHGIELHGTELSGVELHGDELHGDEPGGIEPHDTGHPVIEHRGVEPPVIEHSGTASLGSELRGSELFGADKRQPESRFEPGGFTEPETPPRPEPLRGQPPRWPS